MNQNKFLIIGSISLAIFIVFFGGFVVMSERSETSNNSSVDTLVEVNEQYEIGGGYDLVSFPISNTILVEGFDEEVLGQETDPTSTPTVLPTPTIKPIIRILTPTPTVIPTSIPTPAPTIVASSCPRVTQGCVPCNIGERYCRGFAGATTGYQGWACQNNNPGNIRYSSFRSNLIVANGGNAPCGDRGGYMAFNTYADGRNGLKAYIRAINNGQHSAYGSCGDCSLKFFFSKYAPAGDQNDPESYSNRVASWIGVDVEETRLSWIVDNKLEEMVDAIQRMEGWFVQ